MAIREQATESPGQGVRTRNVNAAALGQRAPVLCPHIQGGTLTEVSDGANVLQAMSENECLERLASHDFGRIAMNTDEDVMILPVNYAFVDNNIVIRTAAGSKLQNAPMSKVAFEIDDVSPGHLWGWSVVAKGTALDISSSIDEYSEQLRALPFHSWLSGERNHVMKIKVQEISGRRFGNIPSTS